MWFFMISSTKAWGFTHSKVLVFTYKLYFSVVSLNEFGMDFGNAADSDTIETGKGE